MRINFLRKCFGFTIAFSSIFSNIIFTTHAAPPNDETIAAIKRYTASGGSFNRINKHLRGEPISITEIEQQDIALIHQCIQSNKADKSMYVIRGISVEEANYYKAQQGGTVDRHGFLSTIREPIEFFNSSTKLELSPEQKHMQCLKTDTGFYCFEPCNRAQNFLCQRYILLIHIPAGACALDVSSYSASGDSELEVLLDYTSPLIIQEETTVGELLTETSDRSGIIKTFKKRGSFNSEGENVIIAEVR